MRSIVDRLLGLRIDLTDWYRMAAGDRAAAAAGRHIPRHETAPVSRRCSKRVVNAFACQQLSLEVGLELLNRLATISGARLGRRDDVRYAFPTPQDIARLPPEKYRAIGFSRQKVRALLDLARPITRRELDLESIAGESDAVVRQRLLELRGVGRWTAEYVLSRRLGRLHVFPGDDVGAQKRLARWLGRSRPWTTLACAGRSNGGSPTPAWCISTFCWTGYRRPAPSRAERRLVARKRCAPHCGLTSSERSCA